MATGSHDDVGGGWALDLLPAPGGGDGAGAGAARLHFMALPLPEEDYLPEITQITRNALIAGMRAHRWARGPGGRDGRPPRGRPACKRLRGLCRRSTPLAAATFDRAAWPGTVQPGP